MPVFSVFFMSLFHTYRPHCGMTSPYSSRAPFIDNRTTSPRQELPFQAMIVLLPLPAALADTMPARQGTGRLFFRRILSLPAHKPHYTPDHQGHKTDNNRPCPPHGPLQNIHRSHSDHFLPYDALLKLYHRLSSFQRTVQKKRQLLPACCEASLHRMDHEAISPSNVPGSDTRDNLLPAEIVQNMPDCLSFSWRVQGNLDIKGERDTL